MLNNKVLRYVEAGLMELLFLEGIDSKSNEFIGGFDEKTPFTLTQYEMLFAFVQILKNPDIAEEEKLRGFFAVATGLGKTGGFIAIMKAANRQAKLNNDTVRSVVVEPTIPLLYQTANEEIPIFAPELMKDIGIYGDGKTELDKDTLIITYNAWVKLVSEGVLGPHNMDILINDEGHKVTSNMREELMSDLDELSQSENREEIEAKSQAIEEELENVKNIEKLEKVALAKLSNSKILTLGFTASPDYNDYKSAQNIFKNLIFEKTVIEGIQSGELTEYAEIQTYVRRILLPNFKSDEKDPKRVEQYDREFNKLTGTQVSALKEKGLFQLFMNRLQFGMDNVVKEPLYQKQFGIYVHGTQRANRLAEKINRWSFAKEFTARLGIHKMVSAIHTGKVDSESTKNMDSKERQKRLHDYKRAKAWGFVGDDMLKLGFNHKAMKLLLDSPRSSKVDKIQIVGRSLRRWYNALKERHEGTVIIDAIVYVGHLDPKKDLKLRQKALKEAYPALNVFGGKRLVASRGFDLERGKAVEIDPDYKLTIRKGTKPLPIGKFIEKKADNDNAEINEEPTFEDVSFSSLVNKNGLGTDSTAVEFLNSERQEMDIPDQEYSPKNKIKNFIDLNLPEGTVAYLDDFSVKQFKRELEEAYEGQNRYVIPEEDLDYIKNTMNDKNIAPSDVLKNIREYELGHNLKVNPYYTLRTILSIKDQSTKTAPSEEEFDLIKYSVSSAIPYLNLDETIDHPQILNKKTTRREYLNELKETRRIGARSFWGAFEKECRALGLERATTIQSYFANPVYKDIRQDIYNFLVEKYESLPDHGKKANYKLKEEIDHPERLGEKITRVDYLNELKDCEGMGSAKFFTIFGKECRALGIKNSNILENYFSNNDYRNIPQKVYDFLVKTYQSLLNATHALDEEIDYLKAKKKTTRRGYLNELKDRENMGSIEIFTAYEKKCKALGIENSEVIEDYFSNSNNKVIPQKVYDFLVETYESLSSAIKLDTYPLDEEIDHPEGSEEKITRRKYLNGLKDSRGMGSKNFFRKFEKECRALGFEDAKAIDAYFSKATYKHIPKQIYDFLVKAYQSLPNVKKLDEEIDHPERLGEKTTHRGYLNELKHRKGVSADKIFNIFEKEFKVLGIKSSWAIGSYFSNYNNKKIPQKVYDFLVEKYKSLPDREPSKPKLKALIPPIMGILGYLLPAKTKAAIAIALGTIGSPKEAPKNMTPLPITVNQIPIDRPANDLSGVIIWKQAENSLAAKQQKING